MTSNDKLNVLKDNTESSHFPYWLHRKLPKGGGLFQTGAILKEKRLSTVCEEAKCPNLFECWSKKTATFLVMGKECTRACGFCDIAFSKIPKPLEEDEPERIVESIERLALRHVVITMVARDDLPDQGASHLVKIVEAIRRKVPECTIELLTSDFNGSLSSLETVLSSEPDIFNHNIETVKRLSPRVRHKASYERTLLILAEAKKRGATLKKKIFVKSGIMLGLGEEKEEIKKTMSDLYKAGVDIITIGQYLQASRKKLRVNRFVTPLEFQEYEQYGLSLGVLFVFSGPFIRSSYNAETVLKRVRELS